MSAALPAMIFDHVGVVVRDLDLGQRHINNCLPPQMWTKRFDDAVLGVSVQFCRDASGMTFELIAPLGDNSPVAAIAKSRVGVLNQMAYRVTDLAAAGAQLRASKSVPTGAPKPAIAFDGAMVQFYLSPLGFIIELIESSTFLHKFHTGIVESHEGEGA